MMMNDNGAPALKRRRGRPKGSKDRVKRARRCANQTFAFNLGGEDLANLAAAGRAVDVVGLLRLAQAQIAITIIKEIDTSDDARRKALSQAALALHTMEMNALKYEAKTEFLKDLIAHCRDTEKKHDDPVFEFPEWWPHGDQG